MSELSARIADAVEAGPLNAPPLPRPGSTLPDAFACDSPLLRELREARAALRAMSAVRGRPQALRLALRLALQASGADRGLLGLVQDTGSGSVLVPEAMEGPAQGLADAMRRGELAGATQTLGEPVAAPAASARPAPGGVAAELETLAARLGLAALWAAPLLGGSSTASVLGVLLLGFERAPAADAVALERVHLYAQLAALAAESNGGLEEGAETGAPPAERALPADEHARRLVREQAARLEAQEARRSLAFLAEASTLLDTSLEYEATLQSVVRLAVPALADWAAVLLYEKDEPEPRLVACAHADPDKAQLIRELWHRYPFDHTAPAGVARVLHSGTAEFIGDVEPGRPRSYARDPEHLRLLEALHSRSYMALPLVARGRTLGALSFAVSESERRYDRADLALAEEIARRAALAVDNARLYREAREAVERKDESLRELALADQRKNEFLAMLGHELRNPLGALHTTLELLRSEQHPTPASISWAMGVLHRQVRHMSRIIDDLLDVSRIARGKFELRREPLELGTVLARAIENARPLLEAQRHRLELELPTEPVRLDADPTRLEQVLANLLHNAAKYTDPGGCIRVSASTGTHEDSLAPGWVELRVRDSGMGIAPEVLPRIFDLFAQGQRVHARAEGGLGIGLTLVRNLVELHGGTVHATSAGVGHGSEFVVRLPAPQPAAPPEPRRPAAPAAGVERRARILLVEDNEDAARALSRILVLWGHEVRTAASGPEALVAAVEFRPEIALLDLGLPGMDGYELGRALRQDCGAEPLMLIALTGYGEEEAHARSREAGFDRHLVKPVELGVLRNLLAEVPPSRSRS